MEAGFGGASNVGLVASQLLTAVQVSVLIWGGLVLRGILLSWTFFGGGRFSEPACLCATLEVMG